MNLKIMSYIIIFIALFASPAFAENPFDRADGIVELDTTGWLPGSDRITATTRLDFDPVMIEFGETFKDWDHDYAFLATDLTIKGIILEEIWMRPRLTLQPNFDNFDVNTLGGTTELQIGIHLNGPWADHWEKDDNGDLKLKEINFWGWVHYGKEHNGRWNFGMWFEFYVVKWLAFKADFLGWGTRDDPISFITQQTDIGAEFILELDNRWTVTLLANFKSTGLQGFPRWDPDTKMVFVWQVGIEYRG